MKKQKSGLYRTAVTVAGEKIWISAHTKAELQQKRREVKQRLITGRPASRPITYHELIIKWYTQVYESCMMRPSTYKSAKAIINKWILGTIDEHMYAQAVRRADLQAVITRMQKENLSFVHISRAAFIMSQACKYGMELGCVTADYGHNLIVRRTSPQAHRTAVSSQDIVKMFEAAGDFLPALAILYYTGMRRGEANALTWADVDFDNNTISVNKAYDMASKTVGPCKTVNANRLIDMPDALADILRRFRGTPSGLVCGCENDWKLQAGWIATLYRAGLATHREGRSPSFSKENYDLAYTIHQMRHTYATILYNAGVDPVMASRLMGHSSYKVTADIYTDIEKSQRASATAAINTAFANNLHPTPPNAQNRAK